MKAFFYLLSTLFLLQVWGCSSDNEFWENKADQKLNFPTQSEEYGKAVAKEIRLIVNNLNEMGVDYSSFKSPVELKAQFYKDIENMSSNLTKSRTSILQHQMSPEEFYQEYSNLTAIQIAFFDRIDKEYAKSSSCQDFLRRLLAVNEDIYSSVPEFEQERLLNTTAVLYYGLAEIQRLEEQGQMFLIPYKRIQIPRLRNGGEPNGGGFWNSCQEVLSSVAVAVGSRWSTGAIVTAVTWQAAGVFAILLCFEGETSFCDSFAAKCVEIGWKYQNGKPIKMECDQCYRFCTQNGYWNYQACPLN